MNREEERLEQAKFYNDKGVKDPHIHFLRGTEWADHTMIEKACEWLRYHIQVDEPKIEYNKDGQPLAESFIAHEKARCMAADEIIAKFKKDLGLC